MITLKYLTFMLHRFVKINLKIWIAVFLPLWAIAQSKDNSRKDPYSYRGAELMNKQDDGYRGIWYYIGHIGGEYQYKYAGGLGTYPVNIYPFSVYVPKVHKTFFCYGGTDHKGKTLYHEVGYYNHRTGKVSRPTIVLNKHTGDAHDNPCIQVDKDGYIWLFSNAHGAGRPAFIHRSVKPYDISKFENVHPTKIENGKEVPMTNFSYLQIYYDKGKGFLGLFTHYTVQSLPSGRKACRIAAYMTSPDGVHWSEWHDLANIEQGHYQNSGQQGDTVGTAFNYHPDRKHGAGLDYRTNLYYLQTDDFGKTWKTVTGERARLPLTTIKNDALVHDYVSEGLKVYINDVNFDKRGNPVIMYETTKGWQPGPQNGPRHWYTAHWTGSSWVILPITTSDNNYDMGSLYIEKDGTWRIIAPTAPGPQAYNTGGSIVMWTSPDEGHSWLKVNDLTPGCKNNQSFPRRPVNASPDFYAFWADGNGRKRSESNLYFCNKGGHVFMLPREMKKKKMKPIPVYSNK
jgi:hypothetical protein